MEEEAWLAKAEKEIRSAEKNLPIKEYEIVAFLAQQAAEKALKAVQIRQQARFDRVHDLAALARSIRAPDAVMAHCLVLTPYYTVTRYPDSEEQVSAAVARALLEKSKEVVAWAKRTLGQ